MTDLELLSPAGDIEIFKAVVDAGVDGVYFGVWAPNAAEVYVIGEFNNWDEKSHALYKLGAGGIWGRFFESVPIGSLYKYLIITPDGTKLYKADPFANKAELRPGTASITSDITKIKWTDSAGAVKINI